MATVSTPCTRICILAPATGLCEGCGRTRDEIARWSGMSEEARLAVMAKLADRLAAVAKADAPREESA